RCEAKNERHAKRTKDAETSRIWRVVFEDWIQSIPSSGSVRTSGNPERKIQGTGRDLERKIDGMHARAGDNHPPSQARKSAVAKTARRLLLGLLLGLLLRLLLR